MPQGAMRKGFDPRHHPARQDETGLGLKGLSFFAQGF
jgi:hypothetical protein